MRTVLAILIASLVSPSFAKEDPLRGRMVCAVSASKFVPANENYDASIEFRREVYSPGAILNFDYAYDLEDGIEIFLGEPNGESVLIEEPFPSSSFKGISRTTKSVEYRKTYSEVSLDDFLINYKGNDQLFLRKCGSKEWEGFYVQTYAAGRFVQVVTLNCRSYVDTYDEVLARLKLNN